MMADVLTRRIGALVLPDLFCELVSDGHDAKAPFAVVEIQKEENRLEEAVYGNVLCAASNAAYRLGVRAGQTVVEARSIVASLAICGLTPRAIRQALGRVAEVLLAFGPTASIDSGHASYPLDTVWIDLTRAAHLRGGEAAT